MCKVKCQKTHWNLFTWSKMNFGGPARGMQTQIYIWWQSVRVVSDCVSWTANCFLVTSILRAKRQQARRKCSNIPFNGRDDTSPTGTQKLDIETHLVTMYRYVCLELLVLSLVLTSASGMFWIDGYCSSTLRITTSLHASTGVDIQNYCLIEVERSAVGLVSSRWKKK